MQNICICRFSSKNIIYTHVTWHNISKWNTTWNKQKESWKTWPLKYRWHLSSATKIRPPQESGTIFTWRMSYEKGALRSVTGNLSRQAARCVAKWVTDRYIFKVCTRFQLLASGWLNNVEIHSTVPATVKIKVELSCYHWFLERFLTIPFSRPFSWRKPVLWFINMQLPAVMVHWSRFLAGDAKWLMFQLSSGRLSFHLYLANARSCY